MAMRFLPISLFSDGLRLGIKQIPKRILRQDEIDATTGLVEAQRYSVNTYYEPVNIPNQYRTSVDAAKLLTIVKVDNPSDRLQLQFVPQEMTIKRDGELESVRIIGRNTAYYQFNSGERSIELEVDFHTDDETMSGIDVMQKVSWLESLTYMNSFKSSLPKVYLLFGKMFLESNEKWILKPPFEPKLMDFNLSADENTFYPRRANVKLTFVCEADDDIKRDSIANRFNY